MVQLLCTVRGCGRPLEREARTHRCPAGHAFDLARRGHLNLLQPQERRSRRPGDDRATVAARRRWLERGAAAPLVAALGALLEEAAPRRPLALLDVGCGDGFFLDALGAGRRLEAHGVDISAAAIEAAARRLPRATLVVANADRGLPYADRSFDVVTSIHSRLHPREMRRVLAADGLLVVAVPAPDDLVELRAAVLGEARQRDRAARLEAELAGDFHLEGRHEARGTLTLDRAALLDALAVTYRGGRRSQRERVDGLEGLSVTVSSLVLWFRPLAGPRG